MKKPEEKPAIIKQPQKKNGGVVINDLAVELKYLRATVRDVGESFIMRREGEIETLLTYLEGLSARQVKDDAREWLHEVRHLKVKPQKGRLRDLKAIDALLEKLLDTIIDAGKASSGSVAGKRKPAPLTLILPAVEGQGS
jgi:hypothetical protein